jgi:cyclase
MYKRLIPSILIRQGRLVKGRQYSDYRDAGAPATTARAHNYQGADELAVADIDASRTNSEPDFETLKTVAEACFMPLTIFGGINSLDRAARCMDVGADKIGLTTAAYDNPELISLLAHQYGAQAVVLGLDVTKDREGRYRLFDHRTKTILKGNHDPFEWAREAVDRGCGEVRLMAVANEGMMGGLDLDLYQQLSVLIKVPVILEGGAGSLEHIERAYKRGVAAVSVGSMLVFSDANLVKIKQHMRTRTIAIRA